MTKRLPTALALLVVAGGLAACQAPGPQMAMRSAPAAPAATPMDGRWASADGIFVASFAGGRFTSVDAQTDAVLAQGSYQVSNGQVAMNWVSTSTSEQRSASCSFVSSSRVTCVQPGGASFDLNRA